MQSPSYYTTFPSPNFLGNQTEITQRRKRKKIDLSLGVLEPETDTGAAEPGSGLRSGGGGWDEKVWKAEGVGWW